MATNEPPRPRTYQAASKIGRHLLSTRDTLRTNSPRSSAKPSEARSRRAKRDRRAKRGRRRRRPAPPGAPEPREGRQEKLEATELGAIQLPRFNCLGSAGRVRSTYGIQALGGLLQLVLADRLPLHVVSGKIPRRLVSSLCAMIHNRLSDSPFLAQPRVQVDSCVLAVIGTR